MAPGWGPQEHGLREAEQGSGLAGSSKEVGVGQSFGVTDTQVVPGTGEGNFHT